MKKVLLFTCFTLLVITTHHAQVGIGTTSPSDASLLDIAATNKGILIPRVSINNLAAQAPITGTMVTSMLVYNTNTTTGAGFHYWDGTRWIKLQNEFPANTFWEADGNINTTPGTGANQHYLGTTDNRDFVIATNNIEALRVKANRNVGIGVNNPLKKMHVDASTANEDVRLTNGNINADYTLNGTNIDFNNSSSLGSFSYDFAGNPRISIENTLLYPVFNALDNLATTGYDMGRFNQHFRRVYTQGVHTNDDTVNGGLRIAIGSSGGSVPDYQFSDFAFFPATTNIKDLGRTNNVWRNFYYQNAIQLSDRRLKQQIKVLESGLNTVMQLQTYAYAYNSDPSKTHFGFMAQEVDTILPELVSVGTDDAQTMGVNYIELIPVLVNAIKEQQAQIEALEERLKEKGI